MAANFVSIATIVHACAVVFDVRVRDIRSPDRNLVVCAARGAAALLAHELLEVGTPTIGRVLSRDHSSIIQSIRATRRRCAKDLVYAGKIDQARQALKLIASSDLARLIDDPDAIETAQRICGNPFREATRVSTLETVAMAVRLLALEDIAARSFQLILRLDGATSAATTELIADLAAMLRGLGYAPEESPTPPHKEVINV